MYLSSVALLCWALTNSNLPQESVICVHDWKTTNLHDMADNLQ